MSSQHTALRDGNRLKAGVIGVGKMGKQHARVYSELQGVDLVGLHDANRERAETVAAEYETTPRGYDPLLERADLVSIAVPTPYHAEAIERCIDYGVDALVEKPFVDDIERGEQLAARASDTNVTLQIGHIERFNPATRVLADIVPELDVVAIDIDRLGPPIDRNNGDSVVMDLMVHDIDILLSLVDSEIESVSTAARNRRHATAQVTFEDRSVASLTASRLTHQKIRQLAVTARSCRVNVDFISQTVEIHRRSLPEYVESNGDIRYRHESVVERPMVENGEPLKGELAAFVAAVRDGTEPLVTPEDGLEVLRVARDIERRAFAPEVSSA